MASVFLVFFASSMGREIRTRGSFAQRIVPIKIQTFNFYLNFMRIEYSFLNLLIISLSKIRFLLGNEEDFAQVSCKFTGIKSRHRILISVKHISLTGKGLRKTSSSVL